MVATSASATTAPRPTSSPQLSNATCESRTINYITHRLPQQCLKSSWQHVNGTTSTQADGVAEATGNADVAEISAHMTPTGKNATDDSNISQGSAINKESEKQATTTTNDLPPIPTSADSTPTQTAAEEDPAFGDATFISFEDWKQQNLEKVGQNPEIGERRQKAGSRDRDSIHNALDTFGEEGEISLDFMGFTGHGHDETATPGDTETGTAGTGAQKTPAVKPRSKDAGTTCKERFNYASFDAGSTIKKANPEAKSATKILSENKDSYMLNQCSASNKFFIVELSDDILVDTVVLANFEFFSSQFRQFRVSVSDRYPVKLDRWVDLGTFEAQNARGIQAFLVEEPKIWARYLKIEFLTHYGKEFYCPISLLRIHGRTMISEFRAEEEAARGEADTDEEAEGSREEAGEKLIPEAVAAVVVEEKIAEQLKEANAAHVELKASEEEEVLNHEKIMEANKDKTSYHVPNPPITPWLKPDLREWPLSEVNLQVCLASDANLSTDTTKSALQREEAKDKENLTATPGISDTEVLNVSTPKSESPSAPIASPSLIDKLSKTVSEMKESVKTLTSPSASRIDNDTATAIINATTKPSHTQQRPNSTTSSPAPAAPSTQESFFKTVHKRLQFLEANSTLSLQYIESQSALLRDAFQKVEKRQLAKTSNFLESLNETVMNELRVFRQQYDQIWQSTVIELESQRERSDREILEVSRRMTLLADEVIFQKRMSIVQSVLLLLCLGLVLFSNRGSREYLALPMENIRHRLRGASADINVGGYASSPSPSPGLHESNFMHREEALRPDMRRANSSWEGNSRHKRTKSYDSLDESDHMGRSSTFEESPSTPFSMYSKPLPELSNSSPIGKGLDDSENPSSMAHVYESNDSDVGDRNHVHPGGPRISRGVPSFSNGNGNSAGDIQAYATPPPEDGLAGVSRNVCGNDSRSNARVNGIRKTSVIARKPLPALPPEIDDESDENTTG